MRHLPTWFPGAGFKRTAARWAETLTKMVESPHQYVKEQMARPIIYTRFCLTDTKHSPIQASGTAESSFTSSLLEAKAHIISEEEHDIKWAALSLYAGGADTASSFLR